MDLNLYKFDPTFGRSVHDLSALLSLVIQLLILIFVFSALIFFSGTFIPCPRRVWIRPVRSDVLLNIPLSHLLFGPVDVLSRPRVFAPFNLSLCLFVAPFKNVPPFSKTSWLPSTLTRWGLRHDCHCLWSVTFSQLWSRRRGSQLFQAVCFSSQKLNPSVASFFGKGSLLKNVKRRGRKAKKE